jgi:protein SCO1/2
MKALWIGAVAGVAAIAASGGWVWMSRGGDFDQCRGSTIAGAGDLGGAFELVSESGETVTDAEVFDRPALLYFGYTYCPDVCPIDAVRNADAVDLLADAGVTVRPVFISVDPRRDTPEVLEEYTSYMHEEMLGLTGTPAQVKAAADAYRVFFRVPEAEGNDYLVDHSAFTYLILPEHGFVDFFRRDLTAEAVAARTACFLDAADRI